MKEIEELKREIELLKERNKKVELNKAWETSNTRKFLLVAITYIVITLTLIAIGNDRPFINSIIPCIGFYLSTLSISFIKDLWRKYLYMVHK